jgi:hypothetical protein
LHDVERAAKLVIGELHRQPIGSSVWLVGDLHDLHVHAFKGGALQFEVQIELCGATAAANHWGNADLLPGVKVNTNAMVRVTQLEQDGFTLIYE